MDIGIVGLGRMGGNMARRLVRAGVRVAGFDPDPNARSALAADSVASVDTLAALVAALPSPRVVWMMVPAGEVTERTLDGLAPLLAPGDLVVDGGNANYKDSQRRASAMAARSIHFVDCGVSGGVHGLDQGYALMFGGSPEAAAMLAKIGRSRSTASSSPPIIRQ